ncbi:MAG TPA: energy transducer TonB [Sphingomicrobium sp.]|nr:energy transducer TonB [Sphingomicrobium sp.]
MSSYRGSGRQDRVKAIAAVAIIHVALGAAIVTGLNVEIVRNTVERLRTFDIAIPKPPPPPPPPPPEEQPRDAKADEGAPEEAPAPSPVVAPKPALPVESPLRAAEVAGTGSASAAGAGGRGTGTGRGGTGSGAGTGSGRGFTPAQRISRVPNSEYRRFVELSGMRSGRVGLMVKVNTDGRPSNCRITRSSGNAAADSLMCQLTERYVRFRPAIDPQGRPVAQDIGWAPDWSPL